MPEIDLVRDIRQQPFYWIERDFLPTYAPNIGPLGIAVYNALVFRASRDGRAWPGLSDLSSLTGIRSRTTLRRVLRDLEKARLITIRQRFNGLINESNEYFILPIRPLPPGSSNDLPGSPNDLPLGQEMTYLGQEMTYPRSGNDPEQQSYNNNHEQQSDNNSKQQACMMLPAAAADLLAEFAIDPTNLNGQGETLAAWLAYTKTQPGLVKPAGYAVTQLRKGKQPDSVFSEIVAIDLPWDELLHHAYYEQQYRDNPNVQGIPLIEDLEPVSDAAVKVLSNLFEVIP